VVFLPSFAALVMDWDIEEVYSFFSVSLGLNILLILENLRNGFVAVVVLLLAAAVVAAAE